MRRAEFVDGVAHHIHVPAILPSRDGRIGFKDILNRPSIALSMQSIARTKLWTDCNQQRDDRNLRRAGYEMARTRHAATGDD
jgi:hypothetical protein